MFAPLRLALVAAAAALLLSGCQSIDRQFNSVEKALSEPTAATAAAAAKATNAAVTATAAATATAAGTAAGCTLTISAATTAYNRPSTQAAPFGALSAGESYPVAGKTADGWVGFDPGVAQAANVGPFRLRWVQPGPGAAVTGDCAGVPGVPPLSPTACYEMAMEETPVLAQPAAGAEQTATLQPGDYAPVTGVNGSYLALDMAGSSARGAGLGWIAKQYANYNGPCENLPTVTPAP